ncbi:MAG: bifunctional 5,10-methylenetetrahydrofolate dehydrogenase/5,10-methenyltetrahydrofolate cyclohydrolase, partial [Planctomycetota bacterium]
VGKPLAMLLASHDAGCGPATANATVTLAHSRTKDLPDVIRGADIVVAAVGRPHFITADMLKPGCVVVDVGINRIEENGDSRLVGDVEYDAASKVASAITPVPGGVGPLTIAMLLRNTVRACQELAQA